MAIVSIGTATTTPMLFGTGVDKFLTNYLEGFSDIYITSNAAVGQNTQAGRLQPWLTQSPIDAVTSSTSLGKFINNYGQSSVNAVTSSTVGLGQDTQAGRLQPYNGQTGTSPIQPSTALDKFLANYADGLISIPITAGPALNQTTPQGRIQPFNGQTGGTSIGAIGTREVNTFIEKGFRSDRARILDLDLYGAVKTNTLTTPIYQFWS